MFDDTPVDEEFAYHNPAIRQCAAFIMDCEDPENRLGNYTTGQSRDRLEQCPAIAMPGCEFCITCQREFDAEERAQRLDEMPNTDEEDLY